MPSLLENLKTRRDAIGVELAALDTTRNGGKPNASVGESVDHQGYKSGLYAELDRLNAMIDKLQDDPNAGGDGPFEFVTQGV